MAVELFRGNHAFLGGERRRVLLSLRPSSSPPPPCLSMQPSRRRRTTEAALIATNASTSPCIDTLPHAQAARYREEGKGSREVVTHEKLDLWMRESIGEIVRNIGEAPFLLHIFSVEGGGGHNGSSSSCYSSSSFSSVRVQREAAASAESWPHVKKRWERGNCMPDGVVLIEELNMEEGEVADANASDEAASTSTSCSPDGSNRTWGLVVQGRGLDCAACYILNTCRVRSTLGFCTHFCLVRAQCFGEPVPTQVKKAWLQGR